MCTIIYFCGEIIKNQFTLIILKCKGLSEILQDIRTATYQISRIEEKINQTTKFHKLICNLMPEVRGILKILWKRGEKMLLRSNFSAFHNILLPVVRFPCEKRGQIFTSR